MWFLLRKFSSIPGIVFLGHTHILCFLSLVNSYRWRCTSFTIFSHSHYYVGQDDSGGGVEKRGCACGEAADDGTLSVYSRGNCTAWRDAVLFFVYTYFKIAGHDGVHAVSDGGTKYPKTEGASTTTKFTIEFILNSRCTSMQFYCNSAESDTTMRDLSYEKLE